VAEGTPLGYLLAHAPLIHLHGLCQVTLFGINMEIILKATISTILTLVAIGMAITIFYHYPVITAIAIVVCVITSTIFLKWITYYDDKK
jgi:hypothetical protein